MTHVLPQPTSRDLLGWHFQPLAPPDTLHPILPHAPPGVPEQRRDSSVPVAPILAGQRDNGPRQGILIGSVDRRVALAAAPLTQQPAGVPFRQPVLSPSVCHRAPPARGLEVSLGDIPQHLLLQRQVRHHPLETRILLLQLLQTSGLVQLQPPVLLPPAVIGLKELEKEN